MICSNVTHIILVASFATDKAPYRCDGGRRCGEDMVILGCRGMGKTSAEENLGVISARPRTAIRRLWRRAYPI
jgi:hypothetical protein